MAYEKLVLAAALEPCELGQQFASLPPHSPHVSNIRALSEGQDIHLDEVQLFKYLEPDLKTVEAIYSSQGARVNG